MCLTVVAQSLASVQARQHSKELELLLLGICDTGSYWVNNMQRQST